MDSSVLQEKWTRLRESVKQFFKMKDDDLAKLDESADKADALMDILQHRYGFTADEAHDELDRFIRQKAGSA
jgi:hypothetical protein